MGKSKKPRVPFYNHADGPAHKKKKPNEPRTAKKDQNQNKKPQTQNQGPKQSGKPQANQLPTVPFHPNDRILLIGEGDFSFAVSLVGHHGCRNVLATCYDEEKVVFEKYPQTRGYVERLRGIAEGKNEEGEGDAARKRGREDGEEQDSDQEEADGSPEEKHENEKKKSNQPGHTLQSPSILFGIDARKLGSGPSGGGKLVRNGFPRPLPPSKPHHHRSQSQQQQQQGKQLGKQEGGPWDIICFNFPHVGGLSKDVNRQVRANQELLVAFFKAAAPLLSAPLKSSQVQDSDEDECDDYDYDYNSDEELEEDDRKKASKHIRTDPGQIMVTLFEGEPYTLWNIRDLARHAGLRVVTSFRFPWGSYPGYSHARTIGEIEGRHGGRGGWRGEDREARMYVFERREWEGRESGGGKGKKGGKRRRGGGSESESE